MASARRIALSTAVNFARRIDLLKQWRRLPHWSTNTCRSIHSMKDRLSAKTRHDFGEIGYTVDLVDLLSTPERDFLLKNNGQKVPISSLEGKLVGLYFCQSIYHPPRKKAIKKVFEEAKSRGYDFEIVQITLHYHSFNEKHFGIEDISWLTLPFMDPSSTKIQRIFECVDDENKRWHRDCLVLIHPCQAEDDDSSGVLFEFSGAEILEQWGIEGYPFTRQSLYKAEYELQKRELTLQSLFPPGEGLLRSAGDRVDIVNAVSQLSGKRVLVFFAEPFVGSDWKEGVRVGNFISMLKSEYWAQVEDNVAEESKFEVVYVSTNCFRKSCFGEFTKDMPWLSVRPSLGGTTSCLLSKVFRPYALRKPTVLAFNEQGELIAKDGIGENNDGDKLRFPFIGQDLEKCIHEEVEALCPSIHCKKNYDLSTAVKQWSGSDVSTAVKQCRVKGLPFSKKDCYNIREIGYTVNVADLLTTPERDFLVKNNGQKIKVDDLKGKTIVLFIIPLDKYVTRPEDTWDMIDAYSELLRVGNDIEFVFVSIRLDSAEYVDKRIMSQEALFHQLFSTLPFPAVPFSDVQGLEGPVVKTFSVDEPDYCYDHYSNKINKQSYWVVIDPTNTVVATRFFHYSLFKNFGGAELYPLSRQRISTLESGNPGKFKGDRISQWYRLLVSETRDFLLSSNGDKVPISSLKGKLVGLYFCENIPHPPRMQAIKKVYEEAKSRGYDFEIVQITFHYLPFDARHCVTDPTVLQCREDVSWLTLPFKDPSCRKLQHIFKWINHDKYGDSLVLIHPDHTVAEAEGREFFEFPGAEILERVGIEGYPFTRQSLYEAEYGLQKRDIRLQSLFPPEECLLRSAGDGFDLVDAVSQLSGKRVLVFFAPHSGHDVKEGAHIGNFVSMLKCEYEAQVEDNVAEERKFEVVYVSTAFTEESSFDEFTKNMPWLVRPFSSDSCRDLLRKVFKQGAREPAAAAFNEQGELIAKEENLGEKKEGDKLRFPFIDQDLEERIRDEVEDICYVSESDSDYM